MNKAIVTGLCTSESPPSRIVLSPRNAENAAELRETFPSIVTVATSNQEVVDGSQHVFLGVAARQTEEILEPLAFRGDQTVCSLMAGVSKSDLCDANSSLQGVQSLVKAVPLPPVQHQAGVTLVHPAHGPTLSLFNKLGQSVPVSDETDMNRLMTMACLMGAQYQWMQVVTNWMAEQGVDKKTASSFVGALSHSITSDAAAVGSQGFEGLIAEQTPGGVNEKAIAHLSEAGVYDELRDCLGMIYETLEPDACRADESFVGRTLTLG